MKADDRCRCADIVGTCWKCRKEMDVAKTANGVCVAQDCSRRRVFGSKLCIKHMTPSGAWEKRRYNLEYIQPHREN